MSPARRTGALPCGWSEMVIHLARAAYGRLILSAALHFAADVVSHHVRGASRPGAATSLYDGLHTAFSLGQVSFGVLGALVAWRAPGLVSEGPMLPLSALTGLAWLAMAFLFMHYWQPRFMVGTFCVLVCAAWLSR